MSAALVLCAAAAEAAVFAQPAARCGALARTRAAAVTMSEPEAVSSLPRFGRREALLLGVSGLGGWRYVSSGTAPTSLEGPIGTYKESIDMRGKTVLVTGANAGIGFETAKRLAEEGATVVMAGRSLERLGNAAERIRARYPAAILETLELDLASLASVRACAKAFRAKHATLDVLLNNAGVSAIPQRSETVDGNERIFQVNFLGHFLLTNLLMDALRASAAPRIINVSSRASFLPNAKLDLAEGSDNLQHVSKEYDTCQTPIDCPAYAASKLEQLLFTKELHKRLGGADSRALVVALHPGLVATELFRYSTLVGPEGSLSIPAARYDDPGAARALNFWGFKTPSQGAQTSIYAATSPELTPRSAGGHFLRDCADADDEAVLATSLLGFGYTDEKESGALWRRSEQLSGADFRPEPMLLKSAATRS